MSDMSDAELNDCIIKHWHLSGLLAIWFLVFGVVSVAKADPVFDRFISEVRKEAAGQGISERHLVNLDRLTPEPEVTRLASSLSLIHI